MHFVNRLLSPSAGQEKDETDEKDGLVNTQGYLTCTTACFFFDSGRAVEMYTMSPTLHGKRRPWYLKTDSSNTRVPTEASSNELQRAEGFGSSLTFLEYLADVLLIVSHELGVFFHPFTIPEIHDAFAK